MIWRWRTQIHGRTIAFTTSIRMAWCANHQGSQHGSAPEPWPEENPTRAVLTQDGRVLVEQPDGSYRPAAPRTDWDRVRAMSDEEKWPPRPIPTRPPRRGVLAGGPRRLPSSGLQEAHRAAHRRGRAGLVPRPRARLTRAASTPCCAPYVEAQQRGGRQAGRSYHHARVLKTLRPEGHLRLTR